MDFQVKWEKTTVTEDQVIRALIILPSLPVIACMFGTAIWAFSVAQDGQRKFMFDSYEWFRSRYGKAAIGFVSLIIMMVPTAIFVMGVGSESSLKVSNSVFFGGLLMMAFLLNELRLFCREKYPQYLDAGYWFRNK